MSDALQYGALGVLAFLLAGILAIARAAAMPLLRDILSTNRSLRELCDALRASLVGQGQRLERVERTVDATADATTEAVRRLEQLEAVADDTNEMVGELWRERFGSNRKTAPPDKKS